MLSGAALHGVPGSALMVTHPRVPWDAPEAGTSLPRGQSPSPSTPATDLGAHPSFLHWGSYPPASVGAKVVQGCSPPSLHLAAVPLLRSKGAPCR